MTCQFDFHTHSTASDGKLNPAELVERALGNGVTYLALTDHDTTAGLNEAQSAAELAGIQLIPGIELSVTWQNQCFHIVGLNINPDHPSLREGIDSLQQMRYSRAIEMGKRLEKIGIPGAHDGARKLAGRGMITRTHFARYLVCENHVSSLQKAFDRYLAHGKPGFVSTRWADLDQALSWITGAGGIPILAHPRRYKLTATRMKRLLLDFKASGGKAIEVISGNSTPDDISTLAQLARQFDLFGSVGSDFHSPDNRWIELGRLRPLPSDIFPVWKALGIDESASEEVATH